jgi:hypothetical protein
MRRIINVLVLGLMFLIIIAGGYHAYFSDGKKDIQGELKGPFKHEGGYCWSIPLKEFANWADSQPQPEHSTLIIYENGVALGPGHSLHDNIRKIGRGRFSHWGETLYFSTSDNSDPNNNGRQYAYKASALSLHLPVARNLMYVLLVMALSGGVAGLVALTIFSNLVRLNKCLYFIAIINFGLVLFLYANTVSPIVWYGKVIHIFIFLFLLSVFTSFFLIYPEVITKSNLSGRKKLLFSIVTLWSLFGTFVLLFEVFFRIFPVYDTLALNPGIKFFWPDYVNYPLNTMGYRDREFDLQKTSATYRILMVGDSFTEGSGCRREETFAGVLERELTRRLQAAGCPRQVEVYNLGRCGANTVEEVQLILREGPILDPDLIILAYVLNDPETHPPDIKIYDPPAWISAIHKIFLEEFNSYAYYWFFNKFTVFRGHISSWDDYCLAVHNSKYQGWIKTNEAISTLSNFIKEKNIDFLSIIFPKFNQGTYPSHLRVIHQQVSQMMQKKEIEVIDLLEFYEKNDKNFFVFAFSAEDQHPNILAHNLLGQYLAGLIWERKTFQQVREECRLSQ